MVSSLLRNGSRSSVWSSSQWVRLKDTFCCTTQAFRVGLAAAQSLTSSDSCWESSISVLRGVFVCLASAHSSSTVPLLAVLVRLVLKL